MKKKPLLKVKKPVVDKTKQRKYKSQFHTSGQDLMDVLKDPQMTKGIKDGDLIFCRNDGRVIRKIDGQFNLVGYDIDLLEQIHDTQKAQDYKENTAFKIIERTAKMDAYWRAGIEVKNLLGSYSKLEDLVEGLESLDRYLDEKVESHKKYIVGQKVVYNYATQNFEPIEKKEK